MRFKILEVCVGTQIERFFEIMPLVSISRHVIRSSEDRCVAEDDNLSPMTHIKSAKILILNKIQPCLSLSASCLQQSL